MTQNNNNTKRVVNATPVNLKPTVQEPPPLDTDEDDDDDEETFVPNIPSQFLKPQAQQQQQYKPMGVPAKSQVVQSSRPMYIARERPGMVVPYKAVLRLLAFPVAVAVAIVGGVFDSMAVASLFDESFSWVGWFFTMLIALVELYFWLHFHDKSPWDVLKMMWYGTLGFGGYISLCTVVLSIVLNYFGLVYAASHHMVQQVTTTVVQGKAVQVTERVQQYNTHWDSAGYVSPLFMFFGFMMSVSIGVFFNYGFTGKLFGNKTS